MILAPSLLKTIVVTLSIAASVTTTKSNTCQKLEGLYQVNIDTVDVALRAFEQCASLRMDPRSCLIESHALLLSQEQLQASFNDYLSTCGSRDC